MLASSKLPLHSAKSQWFLATVLFLFCPLALAQTADFWTPARKNTVAEMLPRQVPNLLPNGAVIENVALRDHAIGVTIQRVGAETLLFTLLPRTAPRVLGESVLFDVSAAAGDDGGVQRAALVELIRQREGNFSWIDEPNAAPVTARNAKAEKPAQTAAAPSTNAVEPPDPERQYWVLLPIVAVALAMWRVTRKALT